MKLLFIIVTCLNLISSLEATKYIIIARPQLMKTVHHFMTGGWENPASYFAEGLNVKSFCQRVREALILIYVKKNTKSYETLSDLEEIESNEETLKARYLTGSTNTSEKTETILCKFRENSSVLIAKINDFPHFLLFGNKRVNAYNSQSKNQNSNNSNYGFDTKHPTILAIMAAHELQEYIKPHNVASLLNSEDQLPLEKKLNWIRYTLGCANVSLLKSKKSGIKMGNKYFVRFPKKKKIQTSKKSYFLRCENHYFDDEAEGPSTSTQNNSIWNFIENGFQVKNTNIEQKIKLTETTNFKEWDITEPQKGSFWLHRTVLKKNDEAVVVVVQFDIYVKKK